MARLRLVSLYLCLAAFLARGLHHSARAQFQQDFEYNDATNTYTYTPTTGGAPVTVIDLGPDHLVVLTYNCYYMRDICTNAYNFMQMPRGQTLHPNSEIAAGTYAYDFNTADRNKIRRSHSCPDNWKNHHLCPDAGQKLPMRHDGEWFSSELDPGTDINLLMNHRTLAGTVDRYSKIRYTCDEFPPASFVEGGDGEQADKPAETRCAAMRCQEGVKAEQDWQATAHNNLRRELKRLSSRPFTPDSVAFFKFIMYNSADGNAANVISYIETPTGTTVDRTRPIKQGFKRQAENASAHPADRFRTGLWALDYNELQDLVDAGLATKHSIPANESSVNVSWGMEDNVYGIWDNLTSRDTEPEPVKKLTSKRRGPLSAPVATRSIPSDIVTPLLKRATANDLAKARTIVDKAVAEAAWRNGHRFSRPLRNSYGLLPGSVAGNKHSSPGVNASTYAGVTPLLPITDEIAKAAALVAEAGAVGSVGNATFKRAAAATAAAGTYWMQDLARMGTVPWGDDASYVVFRNVLDYGAVGDGVTDDTEAIKDAMTSGGRCGEKCNGSTTKNAIVYFPPGRYLISSTVPMPFGTQVIGDANNRPTLVASGSFVGLGVLSTDEYTGGDGGNEEYYVNTANFYRQIRNLAIDITPAGANISCLHYQVAQATSLQNVELIASADPATNQIGMYAENGSGGQISDVTFTGGSIGLYGGTQQFTAQRLTFRGCGIGVHVIWDWGWVWKSVTMTDVGVGFRLVSDDNSGNIGSISVLDSSFQNVGTAAVVIAPPSHAVGSGSTGVVLENVALSGVAAAVADTAGTVYLDGSAAVIDEWILGPTYEGSTTARSFSDGGKVGDHRRHAGLLDASGAYFERARPQYEDRAVGDFVHTKAMGAVGDGSTDDTAAFQAAVYASLGKILFVDAGSYILTSTVIIPSGAKLVGETWSQLVASGSYFEDESNPQVLIQVGSVGDVGDVEMQDLIFTTRGATAGLILVEWNIQAATAGSAGLWDCHVRIGGATGTQLTPAECPASTSGTNAGCSAASLMMRLTSQASGYFENLWLWGADHMIDDPDLSDPANEMTQCSIYIARGFLIESTHPTWLYGTASEHAVFYQYNFHNAANIFAGMLQTESAYFQPTPPPPAPFAAVVGSFPGDPDYSCTAGDDFNGCDESWSTIITGSQDIFIAAAGIYTWFSTYSQDCIDTQQCQKTLMKLDGNFANVRIQNLITIGAKYMAVMDGQGIAAADNLNVQTHPFWSQITNLDVGSNGTTNFNEMVWIDPAIWDMDRPAFTCLPPCLVKLPPYPGPTHTVNYPLITVSDGTWTSTITKAPITISEWILDVVTITADSGSGRKAKRAQGFAAFTPVPVTTPYWPSIAYVGNDGESTTTAPSGLAFPTPPAGVVARDVLPNPGDYNFPFVDICAFDDFGCVVPPWMYSGNGGDSFGSDADGGANPDDEDENAEELKTTCPATSRPSPTIVTGSASSSTSTTSSAVISLPPAPSPLEIGHPSKNVVQCFNKGAKAKNIRIQNAAISFCNSMEGAVMGPGYVHKNNYEFPYSGDGSVLRIFMSFEIKEKCTWTLNVDDCRNYFKVATDSCDCSGTNNKQGGKVTNDCYIWTMDPNKRL